MEKIYAPVCLSVVNEPVSGFGPGSGPGWAWVTEGQALVTPSLMIGIDEPIKVGRPPSQPGFSLSGTNRLSLQYVLA